MARATIHHHPPWEGPELAAGPREAATAAAAKPGLPPLPLNGGWARWRKRPAPGADLGARKLKEFPGPAPPRGLGHGGQVREARSAGRWVSGVWRAVDLRFPGAVASLRSGLTGESSGPMLSEAATA